MNDAFIMVPPTEEECRWTIEKLKERTPDLFDGLAGPLQPAALMQAVISVWMGAHSKGIIPVSS